MTAPFGAKIALQHRYATVRHDRVTDIENNLTVRRIRLAILFGDGPVCNRQARTVDVTNLEQRRSVAVPPIS
jgi:hypothetical protein